MMGKPTHDQISSLAYLLWQYYGSGYDTSHGAVQNWLQAEYFLQHGIISTDDPDPLTTLIESQQL